MSKRFTCSWHLIGLVTCFLAGNVSRGWKGTELLVRFTYKSGKEQLNIYEVVWENPTSNR